MEKCECGAEAKRKYQGQPCCKDCYMEFRMPEFLQRRGIPSIYHQAKIDDFKIKVPLDESLMITGAVGCGKTHLMVALIREDILDSNICLPMTSLFVKTNDILFQIRNTYNNNSNETEQTLVEKYCNIPNLYLDDIGLSKISEWGLAVLYQIVDYRYGENLRTIVSSNLDMDHLNDAIGERIVSRLYGMCTKIKLVGQDRRITFGR